MRARTQLAQMALRSLTDVHVRLCVSRQDELSREPPRSAAAAAALLTACLCYERLLLGVAQTCRTCFAKAAGAAQQGQYEYVILQVSFSLRVGTGSRCVSCAGSWCDGQCRCAPRWAAPLWGHALRGHARQCQWTRVDSLARCLVCVVCRCVSSGWGIVRCCAPRSGGSWQDLPYSQYRRIPNIFQYSNRLEFARSVHMCRLGCYPETRKPKT